MTYPYDDQTSQLSARMTQGTGWTNPSVPELIIGTPGLGVIDIGSDIPPELVTFYGTNYSAAVARAIIRFEVSPSGIASPFIYYYLVALAGNAPSSKLGGYAEGWVDDTATVHETHIGFWDGVNSPNRSSIDFGVSSQVLVQFGPNCTVAINNGGVMQVQSGGTLQILNGGLFEVVNGGQFTLDAGSVNNLAGILLINNAGFIEMQGGGFIIGDSGSVLEMKNGSFTLIDVGGQFFIDGVNAPRGLVDVGHITVPPAPLGTAFAGALVQSDGVSAPIYRNGRAFKLVWKGSFNPSTNLAVRWQLVQQNNGTNLSNDVALPFMGSTGNQEFYSEAVFINNSGADINSRMSLQFRSGGAAGTTITPLATSTHPFYFTVHDIGQAADYGFCLSMV